MPRDPSAHSHAPGESCAFLGGRTGNSASVKMPLTSADEADILVLLPKLFLLWKGRQKVDSGQGLLCPF